MSDGFTEMMERTKEVDKLKYTEDVELENCPICGEKMVLVKYVSHVPWYYIRHRFKTECKTIFPENQRLYYGATDHKVGYNKSAMAWNLIVNRYEEDHAQLSLF